MASSADGRDQPEALRTDRQWTGNTMGNPYIVTSPTDSCGGQTMVETHQQYSEKSPFPTSSTCDSSYQTALRCFCRLLRKGRKMLSLNGRSNGSETRAEKRPLPLIVRSLNDPELGYPNVATFQDSSPSYMLYRRFGYLQARALLERQDELRQLEAELEMFDENNEDQLITRDVSEEELAPRRALFERIETVLGRYSSLLISAQQMMAFYRPSETEYHSVYTYLNNEKPLHKEDRTYILHKDDLVTLRPGREHAWLDRSIEFALRKLHRRVPLLKRMFSDEMSDLKTRGEYEVYFSNERINLCANIIITTMILALLVVPTYLLYHVVESGPFSNHTMAVCIGILLVFTLAFSAALSLFTRAKRHEILGAAAAYCAVLVVFFGNINNSSSIQ